MTRFGWILAVNCLLALALDAARAPMITVPTMSKSGGIVEAVYMLNGDIISGKFVEFNLERGLLLEEVAVITKSYHVFSGVTPHYPAIAL